jgi:peroxiredoxin Q/BCP
MKKAETLPNVIQVFIKPDTEEEIREWSENLPAEVLADFPIYRDPDAMLATSFHIPGGYHFHGQMIHYPALILLGPDGKEVFRYIGKDNTDRFPFEQLEMKISELIKK